MISGGDGRGSGGGGKNGSGCGRGGKKGGGVGVGVGPAIKFNSTKLDPKYLVEVNSSFAEFFAAISDMYDDQIKCLSIILPHSGFGIHSMCCSGMPITVIRLTHLHRRHTSDGCGNITFCGNRSQSGTVLDK